MYRIESLLSARLFLSPQSVGQRIFFISNLGGALSLYAMDAGGSVPEPLLPPDLALQNPDLVDGYLFSVFPRLGKILILVDNDGDENYQPMWIPIDGGYPEPVFGERLREYRVQCPKVDLDNNVAYLTAESRTEASYVLWRADLAAGELHEIARSSWGAGVAGADEHARRAVVIEGYTVGDTVAWLWTDGGQARELLIGTPLEERPDDYDAPLTALFDFEFVPGGQGLLFCTALFEDTYGLAYLDLERRGEPRRVTVEGALHTGAGELTGLQHLTDDRFLVSYNIDGVSWAYDAGFDRDARVMRLERVVCGAGELAGGVAETIRYDAGSDAFAIGFSTATSPTQLYTVRRTEPSAIVRHTRERVLGIPAALLSPGEDASFVSWDGLRVSARLYLPSPELGFEGQRPLVYYVHGGPQSQERPDFSWFSMPLIQLLTLNGIAVFVPNARGSTGYGLAYTKRVDRDWGGDDRLDHVYAMQLLRGDARLDARRAGVAGRSYGGYMTLTLAARHPELWSAAVDMFGPYELTAFIDRLPETWKPYFAIAVGDPQRDRAFLEERSPRTYIDAVRCPMLVIQGQNDPRVIEAESRDVVETLRAGGTPVEYLLFPDEGHDVLKYANRVRCYSAIVDFFKQHLGER